MVYIYLYIYVYIYIHIYKVRSDAKVNGAQKVNGTHTERAHTAAAELSRVSIVRVIPSYIWHTFIVDR